MASTYGPEVTFDLPSGEDAAQQVADACGLSPHESERWSKRGGEAPDDTRAAIHDALRYEYGGWVDGWQMLPRKVEYGGARLEVTMVPEDDVYPEGEEPEVQENPRHRLLDTLREYHQELGANTVAEDDLLDETAGDRATLREELARLEQQGEVYQPTPNQYRITSAEVEGDGGE